MARHAAPRNDLTRLMLKHGLTAQRVAEMTGRRLGLVYIWMSKDKRDCPHDTLELLRYKLGEYEHKK